MFQKTVLIFGISSFVGSNLADYLKKYFRVVGTYFETKVIIPGVLTVKCDILSRDQITPLIYAFRPDYVIYAVGLTSIEDCIKHPKLSDALNTSGIINVTSQTEKSRIRTTYLSSAFTFSGMREFTESDTPDSNTFYGKSVTASEFYIQKSCLNYLILRCCRFYGRSVNPRQYTWFEMLQRNIFLNKPIMCDHVIHTGYLDITYLGVLIKLAIEKNISNKLLNFSSKDTLSFFDFAKAYCNIFGISDGLLTKGVWSFPETRFDYGQDQGPHRYYHLKTENIENYFEVEMPNIEESLQFSYQKFGGKANEDKTFIKGTGIQYI